MELQKEQGFSMLSSCLPMIISLIIFFVAIGAFNDYSAYANLQNYNLLVKAYNDALTPYCAEILPENIDDNYIVEENRYILVRDADGTGEDGNQKYIYYTLVYTENYADDDYAYIRNYVGKNCYVDVEKTYAAYGEEIDALVEAGKMKRILPFRSPARTPAAIFGSPRRRTTSSISTAPTSPTA